METERYELYYKINRKRTELILLGHYFYSKNKDFGNFIYKNRRFKLMERFEIKNIKEDKIKIDLIFHRKIYDKRLMFKDCGSLIKCVIPSNENNKIKYPQIISIKEEEESLFDYLSNDNNLSENEFNRTLKDLESVPDYSNIPKNEIINDSKLSTVKAIH